MPTAPRRATTTPDPEPAAPDTAHASPEQGAATTTLAAAREAGVVAAEGTAAAGSASAGTVRRVVTAPVTVVRAVADDVTSTLRRPDAVLYLGGVVGLAAIGILEWPVAAVAGVGLAVASGVRRARA